MCALNDSPFPRPPRVVPVGSRGGWRHRPPPLFAALQADGHPATGSQKAFLVLHALHAKAEVAVASLDALRYPKGGAQLCRAVQGAKSA